MGGPDRLFAFERWANEADRASSVNSLDMGEAKEAGR